MSILRRLHYQYAMVSTKQEIRHDIHRFKGSCILSLFICANVVVLLLVFGMFGWPTSNYIAASNANVLVLMVSVLGAVHWRFGRPQNFRDTVAQLSGVVLAGQAKADRRIAIAYAALSIGTFFLLFAI